jgi:uncharacterized repeat protein (TIGR01451 family)
MTCKTAKWLVVALTVFGLTLLIAGTASAQAGLSIGLSVSPPSETDANGRITYTAVVSNAGPSAANSVVLTFTIPYIDLPISSTPSSCVYTYNGPLFATCPLGNIPSGGTATAVAVVYPTNVGNLFVNADAVDSANDTATSQVGSTLTAVGIADVGVSLTATPNPAQVGATLTYNMTAYNVGDDDAQNVMVTLALPPSATFVSAPKACTRVNAIINCSVGHMVVSGSKTFSISVLPTKSGWTYATALLRRGTVADPSTLDNSSDSRIWVNP